MKTTSVLFAGVGGQGIIKASAILASACMESGLDVKQSEVHGMAQRGGSVVSYVKFGEKVYSPAIEEKTADIIISFEKSETLRWLHFLKKDGFLLINNQEIRPTSLSYSGKVYPNDEIILKTIEGFNYKYIDSIKEAQNLGNIKVFNTILIGAFAKYITNITKESFISAISKSVPPKTLEMNMKAFEYGYGL